MIPAIQPWDLRAKSSALLEFFHVVPAGVSLETAMTASYWRIGWMLLDATPHAEVTLIADDGAYDVTVRLLSITATSVEWRVLREWEPKRAPGRKPNVPDGYQVEHLPGQGWRAVAPDGSVLIEKKASEDDALRAALAHSKKAAA